MATQHAQRAQHPTYEHHDEESGSDVEDGVCGFPEEDGIPGDTKVAEAMQHVRLGFIRKVYSILVMQLLLTIAIAAPICMMSSEWIQNHMSLFAVAKWTSLIIILGMGCCCQKAARTFPTNYLMLFTFTACEGVIIGFVGAVYQTDSVLLAAGITTAVFIGLTAYACFTKTDFTGCGPYLFAVLFALCLWGFIAIFFPMGEFMYKVYGAIGTLLFCCYIVYDTQMIVGGRHHKFQFEIDDYVFAALNLYLDIINLFLFILSLLGNRK